MGERAFERAGRRDPVVQDDDGYAALLAGDAREVLARITAGDALRLRQLAGGFLREGWLLLEPERLYERSAVRVAALASRYDGTREDWVLARVEEAARALLREDQEAERNGEACEPRDPRYAFLTSAFGIEDALTRAAAVRFNALDHTDRKAFFWLLIERKTIAECIEAGLGPLEELRERARKGLFALFLLGEVPELESNGEDGEMS